ncbi:unnamed protein product [Brassica oleracea]
MYVEDGVFYGAKAKINVSPQLYGDNHTRLFTYWTSDAYQGTGCYNLLCSGFVQINREIAMGGSISPLSSYGNSQYDITILIWKIHQSGLGFVYVLFQSVSLFLWSEEKIHFFKEHGPMCILKSL